MPLHRFKSHTYNTELRKHVLPLLIMPAGRVLYSRVCVVRKRVNSIYYYDVFLDRNMYARPKAVTMPPPNAQYLIIFIFKMISDIMEVEVNKTMEENYKCCKEYLDTEKVYEMM